jgi:hypothetical protein
MPSSYGFVESQSGYSGSTIAMRGITLHKIDMKIMKGKKLDEMEEAFLINKVNDLWDYHPDTLFRFPRWRKFLAWTAGYQYYDYSKTTRELQPIPLPRKRKLVFNRLRSFARMFLAKLTATTPNLAVVPNDDNYENQEAAELGDSVLTFLSEKLRFDCLQRTFKMWYILTNAAYLRVYWNEKGSGAVGSRRVSIQNDKGEEIDESWENISEDGEVGMEVVPPFNCRQDPLNFTRENWRWFIYGCEEDAEELEEQYGLEEGILRDVTDTKTENVYILETTGDKDFSIGTPVKQEAIVGRVVTRKQFWTPHMYAYIAGTTLLEYGPNKDGEIPFFKYEERLVPVEHYEKALIYNDPIMKDMIPVQREYNRSKSNTSNAIERAMKLRVLMPYDSGINKTHLIEEAAMTVIDYNPERAKPEQMHMDTMPPFLPQYCSDLEREFESVGGIHEASFGRLPERASHASGVLVNLLVEQDDVVIDPIIKEIDAVFASAWTFAMRLVQKRYSIARIIRVGGDTYADGAIKFRGADLRGNTTVSVNSQIGLPKSRPLRVEYILQLQKQGLLTDTKEILELLEFGNARKVFADVLLHQKAASRENAKIAANPQINEDVTQWIYQFEDSAAHLQIHLRDRLSPKWARYTQNQQNALETHIQATAQKVASDAQAALGQQQQQQAGPQQMAPGQPPTPQEAAPAAPAPGAGQPPLG